MCILKLSCLPQCHLKERIPCQFNQLIWLLINVVIITGWSILITSITKSLFEPIKPGNNSTIEMLIVCNGFSQERMSGLSAWRSVCDCINIKAIVVHSEHPMRAAQQKLLIRDAVCPHQQTYPSTSTDTGTPHVPQPQCSFLLPFLPMLYSSY